MQIKEFIARLEKSNFSLSVENGKLNLKGDKNKLSQQEMDAMKKNMEVISFIKANKSELIEYISSSNEFAAIKKSKNIAAIYKLTGLQQGMLFHALYDHGTEVHKVQFACDFNNVDIKIFKQSWKYVIQQHTVLRTGFFYDSFSVPVQVVYKEVELPIAVMDFSSFSKEEQKAEINKYETHDKVTAFDFKKAPLMRLALIRTGTDSFRMVWTFHHILFDGWSLPLLMEEFLNYYEAILHNRDIKFKEEDHYEDFIKYIDRIDKSKEEKYWQKYLANVKQATLLPFIKNTSERNKGGGTFKSVPIRFDATISATIAAYAQSYRLTVNTLVQGVWSYLLHHYTGNQDISFGVIVSGRPDDLPGVEQRVGLYINTLALHAAIRPEQPVSEWLVSLQAAQVASREFQHTPLSEAQRLTGIQGDLFDTLLVFENYPVNRMIAEDRWSLKVSNTQFHDPTNYPLTILISNSEQLNVSFSYNSLLIEEAYILQVKEQFENVLLQLVKNTDAKISDLKLLTSAEENKLLHTFNDTAVSYAKDKTIAGLFAEQAIKTPTQPAMVFEGEELTYKQLDETSNQLANYLRSKGVKEETLVPICVERSINMIVGVLAILKAGGTYVPIDPEYPAHRISYMLEDMKAALVISSSKSSSRLKVKIGVDVIELDTEKATIENQSKEKINLKVEAHHLAYILYTSGSTGTPKGVKMPGSNLVNLLHWQETQFSNHQRKVLQFASLNFDVSFQEIFSTICFGSTLYLINEERRKDMGALVDDIRSYELTHLFVPYIVLKSLAEYVKSNEVNVELSLQEIITAGEQLKLTVDVKEFVQNHSLDLVNQYGPTEAHVVSSYKVNLLDDSNNLPPIGKPVSNTQLYVLNENMQLTGISIPGELYIAGAQVAAGYLNREELTKEKFVKDIFGKNGEEGMMYKTGDLVRWLPDGNLEYLGRIDEQVKIRGYRVELGEIENVLQQHEQVKQALVLAREDKNGSKRLIGYIVPETIVERETIISYLKSQLPDYMVPALWVEMESFPLSPNGKVARNQLPDADMSAASMHQYVAPNTELEKELATVWQELLGVEKVGVHDNFFELGGHSLLAMRVVSAIRRKVYRELAIKDIFEKPTISELAQQISGKTNETLVPQIEPQQRHERIPLSFSQERLWFIDQLEGTVQYHIPAVLRLKGELDISALGFALKNIIDRHEVIRTVIREVNGEAYQLVLENIAPTITIIDGIQYQNDLPALQEEIKRFIKAPFDLSADLMLRAGIISLSEEENILVVAMHHIASDGWSLSILVKELVELYESFIQQRQPNLALLKLQYADYAIWQNKYLQGETLDKKLAFWKQKLDGVTSLELPLDFERPAVQTSKGAVTGFYIDKELADKLQRFSNQQGVSLYMTLLAALNVLFYKYSGQQDICVGTPIANRTRQETESLIGFFVNTLALRNEVKAETLFTELLQQVKANTLQAYQHQDVPFEKVVDIVTKERDLSRTPLFQVMFVLHNTPEIPSLQLGDVKLTGETFEQESSRFDISLSITETENGLRSSVNYNTSLFKKETIDKMMRHFVQLLNEIVATPQQSVGEIAMLSSEEEDKLVNDFNNTNVNIDEDINIVTLFQKQAAATPDATALVYGQETLSYSELEKRSDALANYLLAKGVGAETIIPICLDKSFELIIGILGLLKAGAAYVPVDPAYPKERIRFMLQDTDATFLVTSSNHIGHLKEIISTDKIITLDKDWAAIESTPYMILKTSISPTQLAYVLYTSGSTGQPKAVMVQHDSLANHLGWFNKQYQFTNADSTLLISSFSFDGAMTATWPVLLSGGTLHLPEDELFDPTAVLKYIGDNKLTYIKTLPGIFKALIEQDIFKERKVCASLRLVIVGGEKMDTTDFKTYLNIYPDILFSNHYGPTECTVSSSFYLIDKSNIGLLGSKSFIGTPVANTQIFILNEAGQLNPAGVPGEICIAGIGVARGYLNRSALTTEKFVTNHFSNIAGTKMYKTGDIGIQSSEGLLEYIGRKDDQVKLRGYRIELGEIEHILQRNALVKQAVVSIKKDQQGSGILVAYIIPAKEFNSAQIAEDLKGQVPGYMVPSLWVEMGEFPLSPNGKINRKALPEPIVNSSIFTNNFVAPRNKTEEIIAAIWMDLLNLTTVGVHDNFFQLGGHSFIAMRVLSALRKQLESGIEIRDIFLYPTIAQLAENILYKDVKASMPAIQISERPHQIPLSFNQQQLWFIDQLSGSVQYHIPSVLKLSGDLNIDALKKSLQAIIERHEILRTVIKDGHGHPYQFVMGMASVEIPLTAIDGTKYKTDESELKAFIHSLVSKPFDLSQDLMMRSDLIKLDEKNSVLVVTMHHIASDGWSGSILVSEMTELYRSYAENRPSLLKPLPLQYADYAIWQQGWLEGETLDKKINYWKNKLEGLEPLQLPTDFNRPAVQSTNGSVATFHISNDIRNSLQKIGNEQESTLFMTLLSAFKIFLYRYTGQQDICVGTGIAGREQQDVESLIGFFVNILALRTEFAGSDSFPGLLQKVKATSLEAFENQSVPFSKIVDSVVMDRDTSRSPLFQVVFVLNNTPDVPEIDLGMLKLTTQQPDHDTSKFDLTFFLSETVDGINGAVEYCTDLFKPATIERMMKHFTKLLSSIAEQPEQAIENLPMLTSMERHQLLTEFNDNKNIIGTENSNLVELFEKQVAKTPTELALVFKEEKLTFGELNEKANKLGRYLVSCGVTQQMLVPVCIEQSADMLVAILAILKTGAAYVPIDTEAPTARINYLLQDTNATIVVSNASNSNKFDNIQSGKIIETDTATTEIEKQSSQNLSVDIKPLELAYIIYTSGSTGRPKGVMVSHAAIVSYLTNGQTKYVSNNKNTGSFIHLSYTFDASLTAMFMPLIYGKAVVIGSKKSVEVFEDENCRKYAPYDFIKLTPAHLELLQSSIADEAGNLLTQKLVVGGEALHYRHFEDFIERKLDVEVINEYGPTEASVGCSTYVFNTAVDYDKIKDGIAIGKPIDNVDLYILNHGNALSPLGIPGEICIAGNGLANGYLNLPELSAERFVPDPFAKTPGAKMYRTGDVGRWHADGNIEYLGRKDDQVKIRGYRIELGEIESALSDVQGITNAVVTVAKNENTDTKKLNAYLQVNKESLPLLNNYLRLLSEKKIQKSELNILPNGLPVFNSNLNEVRFLYSEIFKDHCYLKNGITLKPDSCVIDIGANAGFFTVFLNALSKDIKVYSFEPIPDVFRFLDTNRQLYNIPGKAFQLALLDEEKEVEFTWYPGVSIVSGIKDDHEEVREVVKSYIRNSSHEDTASEEIESMLEVKLESKQIRVKTKTLSQIIAAENIEKIDLLKVDVENSEHLVLNGIIDKDWDKIESAIIEVHDSNGRLQQITELLQRKGFTTHVEKEQMLSEDDILYNLFAIKKTAAIGLSSMGDNDVERAKEWVAIETLEANIRTEIKERLPEYMMPSNLVLVDQFQLTRNGKIDKKALPAIESDNSTMHSDEEPSSELQNSMLEIWKDLLEVDSLGVNDNFFNAGGDSLLAVRVIAAMRKKLEIEIHIREIFDHPTIAGLAGFIVSQDTASTVVPSILTKQARPKYIPLSFSQDRLWFIDQLQGSVQYHIPAVLRLTGKLNEAALEYALQSIVNRHEVLRTVIKENNGHGYQHVLPKNSWQMRKNDGAAYTANKASLQDFVEQLISKPFDLSKDQMLRADLIRLNDEENILVATMHHIASDGWSVAIIVKEVMEFYNSFIENRTPQLSELPIQFADYAIWQKNYLQGEVLDKKLQYWKSKLTGVATLELPYDHNADGNAASGAISKFEIDKELTEELRVLSQQTGATLYMTLLATFNVLMYRYSGQRDICLGTSVAGRQMQELEGLIGFFINAMALRTDVNPNETFAGLLSKVSAETLEAFENQDMPFEKVVDAVLKERDNKTTPLFQVVFAMQNTIEAPELSFGGIQLTGESYAKETAKFNLTCNVGETADGLLGSMQYATSKFSKTTIENMIGHFKELLNLVVANADQKISELVKLKKDDTKEFTTKMNERKADYLWDKTMVDLFEEQASLSPEAIAIIFEDQLMSYRELNEWSNKVARYLLSSDIEAASLVMICMDRSIELYVAILGVLKAGCAYLPVDPANPQERIHFMQKDSKASVAITSKETSVILDGIKNLEIIELEKDIASINNQQAENLLTEIEPNHLAYVIYTSGSTGKPKGVTIMHRSNVNMSMDQVSQFGITSRDRILQFASISFDASVSEIFMALYAGATLVVMKKEIIQDAEHFTANLIKSKVSVVTLPPVYLKALQNDDLSFLRVIITAGEAPDVKQAANLSRYVDYYNAYGPTECAVCATIYKVTPEDASRARMPIGKAIANSTIYILDEDMQQLPEGMQGEIYVAGIGLAKGYLRRPDLTAEKFVPNPFGTGKKLYKTGDLGRFLSDGNLEFLGRIDDQVKLRGYRVELGEIENTLLENDAIETCVVVANEAKDEKQLIAYYKTNNKIKLWPSVAEFYVYDDLLYKTMAGDEARNAKYRNAFRKVVKDKIILEIGPGFEAILSRIAIEEGAKKVYAVELLEQSYIKAKQTVESLGLQDKIIVIHDDITQVELPEKADYCISEIVGAIGGSEGAAVLINSSRRLLKDPSCMIPSRSLTKIAAITLPEDQFDYSFEELGAYYTSKIFEAAGRKFDLRLYLNGLPQQNIISTPATFEDLDYTKEVPLEEEHSIRLDFQQASVMHGFIVWLNLYCDDQELIDTVAEKYTWLPIYFPVFDDGQNVLPGDYIEATISRKISANNLNPDFEVTGSLNRNNRPPLPFVYHSFNSTQTFKGNNFYQKVFAKNDEVKISDKTTKEDLRDFLKAKLPDYMLPSLFIELDEFPVTISGKIDKKALPAPDAMEVLADQYTAPVSEIETALVGIWQEILELDQVGINDDFFELGGHSLMAIRLISLIRKQLGMEVPIGEVFESPTIALLAKKIESNTSKDEVAVISKQQRPEYIPLSFTQERLFFVDQLEGSSQYHMPAVLRLTGDLNIEALQFALQSIVDHHEVLRTIIKIHDGQPYQQVLDKGNWELKLVDATKYKDDKVWQQGFVSNFIQTPFNLSKDYNIRASVLKLDETQHLLVVTLHHIASDGWSFSVIVKELVELYAMFTGGNKTRLPELKIQYADFAIWQRNNLTGEVLNNKLNYWKQKLAGTSSLQLPTDFPRPPVQSIKGAVKNFWIGRELTDQLNKLARENDATLFMTIMAAFNVLLHHYSGQQDICVGTPIANRINQEVESLVGFFVNTLAIRADVNNEDSFKELLLQVKTTTLEAYQYQDVPFEKVVDAVVKERDRSRHPLFQVLFILQNTPDIPEFKLGDVVLENEIFPKTTSKFDLSFALGEISTGLFGAVEYCTDLYSEATVVRMITHFKKLLKDIVTNASEKIGKLSMLDEAEKQQLLVDFNNTAKAYPKDKNIINLFEGQVAKSPASIAIIFQEQQVTYEALDKKANQLAHYLSSKGVKAETLVPVCIERGPDMLVAILGILKAGAAYVPIDPHYPQERISYMLEDTSATILISSAASSSKIIDKNIELIEIDTDWEKISQASNNNLSISIASNNLAYVIYTSGSTGKPKGVMIEHGNLNAFINWSKEEFASSPFDIVYATTSMCFDLSVFEFFYPLVTGKKLRILENGLEISKFLASDKNVLTNSVPVVIENLLKEGIDLSNITVINMAGEPIPKHVQQGLDTARIEVRNLYGPTEDTTYSTVYRLQNCKDILIGKPIANTSIYIVDAAGELVPIGVPGELWIAGDGVTRGYLNRPELTAEKFIQNLFDKESGRLYKTGDLGRWQVDGNIEYLGRIDEQVKIRGYRIELGEIETVANQSGLVNQVIVLAKADPNGSKRLVGYAVAKEGFSKQALNEYLYAKMPDYMVPAIWVELEKLPLTPNGKVDRKALPDPELGDLYNNVFVAPRNATETALANIWQELLTIQQAGVYDNFFELGGHSLLAMRVVSFIRTSLQVEVAIKDIFVYPTIATMAEHLSSKQSVNLLPPVTIQQRPEYIPLSFSQERLFFIDQLEGSRQYHIPATLRLKGDLNIDALKQTLQTIITRHEVLRTVLRQHEGDAYQYLLEATAFELSIIEDASLAKDENQLKDFVYKLVNKPFIMADDYMLRATLVKLAAQEYVLVVTLHHIAADGWSLSIIINELIEIYSAIVENRSAKISTPIVQYADYAIWQRTNIKGEILDRKLNYWKTKLAGTLPLQLPVDFSRPPVLSSRGALKSFQFDKDLAEQLRQLSQRNGATIFMTLLSGLNILLQRYSGQNDICIGTPIANRPVKEVEDLIGLFVNTLALRSDVNGDLSFDQLLQNVKSTTLDAYEHQDIPFEKVVDLVTKERDRSRHPLFQVMFILQNTPDVPKIKLGDLEISGEAFTQNTSRFDLTFAMSENEAGLHGSLEYCTDLYSAESITKMIGHFENLLNAIVQQPSQKIAVLNMLSKAETELLKTFNDTAVSYPKDKTIAGLFAEQALKTPTQSAVVFEGEEFTYQQLDESSNQLANYLKGKGVKEETLVPICVERSINMIVGILAILKAGGTYVPIDPEYPAHRINYMLEDMKASLVISSSKSSSKLSISKEVEVIELDTVKATIENQSKEKIDLKVKPHHLAYILYTSGSTGTPKGVQMPGSNLVNLLLWQEAQFINHQRKVLQFASLNFDVSFQEIFSTICFGSTLYLINEERRKDMAELVKDINQYQLTHLFVPYIVLKTLAEYVRPLQYENINLQEVITAGEQLKLTEDIRTLLERNNIKLVNQYGPTEAHVVSSYTVDNTDKENALPPIGKPVSNTQLYVLNENMQLAGMGIPGELYIAGAQVAAGYLNREELTKEKFVKDIFKNNSGEGMMYKTGDLVRWLADGNLEFLGRIDEQVKIRGYRVELGEIENVLQQHELVKQAVVLAREDKSGNKRLIGYIVPETNFERETISSYLKSKLPDYMVPALWVEMESFPLSPNGKVARNQLPDADMSAASMHEYVAPNTELEQELAAIWQELLGVEKVGVHDNFFELGGHSLLAMKMVAHMKKRLLISIPLQVLFQFPTIGELSNYLEWEADASNEEDDSTFEVINI